MELDLKVFQAYKKLIDVRDELLKTMSLEQVSTAFVNVVKNNDYNDKSIINNNGPKID